MLPGYFLHLYLGRLVHLGWIHFSIHSSLLFYQGFTIQPHAKEKIKTVLIFLAFTKIAPLLYLKEGRQEAMCLRLTSVVLLSPSKKCRPPEVAGL